MTSTWTHLDIILDINGDGAIDDSLVFEHAYNDVALHYLEGPMPYGALTGDWYQTFSDDGNGPAQVDDAAYGWLSSGPPGPPGDPAFISGTLAGWKSGLVDTHGQSPWHLTGQAKLDLNPGAPATSRTQ